jgi:hypothetical protein
VIPLRLKLTRTGWFRPPCPISCSRPLLRVCLAKSLRVLGPGSRKPSLWSRPLRASIPRARSRSAPLALAFFIEFLVFLAVRVHGAVRRATDRHRCGAGKCLLDMLGVFAEFETNLRPSVSSTELQKRTRPASTRAVRPRSRLKPRGMRPVATAKALKIGRASVYSCWGRAPGLRAQVPRQLLLHCRAYLRRRAASIPASNEGSGNRFKGPPPGQPRQDNGIVTDLPSGAQVMAPDPWPHRLLDVLTMTRTFAYCDPAISP